MGTIKANLYFIFIFIVINSTPIPTSAYPKLMLKRFFHQLEHRYAFMKRKCMTPFYTVQVRIHPLKRTFFDTRQLQMYKFSWKTWVV